MLFLFAGVIKTNNLEVVETGAGVQKLLPIYKVATNEKKVALTINCAWSEDDIDLILDTLDKNKVKLTFFVVGDWAEKYRRQFEKNKDCRNGNC